MVQLVLSPKQVAIAGLVLLVAAGCGTPDAAPKPPPSIPTISTSSTSAQVSPTPVPSNNAITVKPLAEPVPVEAPVVEEPVVETTTEAPVPPPEPPPPPPPVETTDPPVDGPFVLQGTACPVEGAVAVNRRLQPMVCTAEDKLRWQPL
jgi:hypothetical protein